ncbi:hypothetical protein Mesop_0859 [Mesorhizobium opportunistum WSM2075]|uniref:Uncharacterized protein n=1 Tax=Mesorhizobium opportunistum (strain LMG 24607 / HAMBI 3007 / WSM2075) TaxID=536019 RepID=F7YA14_MESOW|nr:hypothetical protein Mesop_0859 [Mesorhizobium opportunistum WSM2075]
MVKLREHEKAAVFSILVRQLEAQELKAAAEREIAAANERVAAAQAIMANVRPALAVFGFDTGAGKLWDIVKEAIGVERYNTAFEVAKGEQNESRTGASGESQQSKTEDTGKGEGSGHSRNVDESHTPKIKDIVLERLRQAGDAGARASEIKEFVSAQGIEMHEKTVGMTLYRLSNEGSVHREGRTWVFIPESERDDRGLVAEGTSEPSSSATSFFE